MKISTKLFFTVLSCVVFNFGAKSQPTTAAPVPNVPETSVVSVFCDEYTDLGGTNFEPAWGQSTVYSVIDVVGNSTIEYQTLNWQGIIFGAPVDASSMSFVHFDVWTPNETALVFSLSSVSKETPYALTTLTTNGWNSFNIPLSSFAGVDKAALTQCKFEGKGGTLVYVDNLFFSKVVTTSLHGADLPNSLSIFPNPSSNVIALASDVVIRKVTVTNLLGQAVLVVAINALEAVVDINELPQGQYVINAELQNGSTAINKIIKN